MRAAVWHGTRDVRVEEVPVPEPGPGQVLIEVSRNGICGSDLHTYIGESPLHLPGIVLGHEFAGTVCAVGDGVDDLAVGTTVAVAPIEWCGACLGCGHGWPHLCRKLGFYGGYGQPLDGGLAPYVCVSRRAAFPVPSGLDVVTAALTEPMAVTVHAIRQAPSLVGRSVLVLGAGPIGLGVMQAAKAAGAGPIIVSELGFGRRAAAEAVGATAVVDPRDTEPRQAVRDLTRHGVDVVFDTTADNRAIAQGLPCLRRRGTFVSVGGWTEPATVDFGLATILEIDIRFSLAYEPAIDFPAALAMLADGRFAPDVLISDHIPLERIVEDGLEELLHHAERHVKILVDPA